MIFGVPYIFLVWLIEPCERADATPPLPSDDTTETEPAQALVDGKPPSTRGVEPQRRSSEQNDAWANWNSTN